MNLFGGSGVKSIDCDRKAWKQARLFIPIFAVLISASCALPQTSSSLFSNPVLYDSGGAMAFSIAVADLNGDGKPDLIVANGCTHSQDCREFSSSFGVMLGNGDGTFQPVQIIGNNSGVIAVADMNGDGKPDIVTAVYCTPTSYTCDAGGAVGILLGNGDGTFQPAVYYPSGGYGASSLAIADVNGDGKPDVLVLNAYASAYGPDNGTMGVLLNNGDGTLQPALIYTAGTTLGSWLAVADLDGDGKPDAVIAGLCQDATACLDINLLKGNGDGTFNSLAAYSSGGISSTSVAIGDINRDGKPDIVVATNINCPDSTSCPNGSGVVSVLVGNGNGTFQPAVSYPSGSSDADYVQVSDINGDRNPDILVFNECGDLTCTGGGIAVLLGNGDGTFQAAANYPTGISYSYPGAFVVDDLNSDGKPDLAVAQGCLYDADCLSVLLNSGVSPTQIGTIEVKTNEASASFTISGPATFSGSGVSATYPNAPAGEYTISFGKISGYETPANQSLTLSAKGTIEFSGVYLTNGPSMVLSGSGLVSNSWPFGNQQKGTSTSHTLTIWNSGSSTIAISAPAISGTNKGAFSAKENCSSPIPPNGQCTIIVKFQPPAVGPETAELTVSGTAGSKTLKQVINLSGTGVAGLSLAPSFSLGNALIGESVRKQFVLTNDTGTTLNFDSFSTGSVEFSETDNCGKGVPYKGSCTVTISFTPVAPGTRSATLTIQDDALNSPQTVDLTGTGVNIASNTTPRLVAYTGLRTNPDVVLNQVTHLIITGITPDSNGSLAGTSSFAAKTVDAQKQVGAAGAYVKVMAMIGTGNASSAAAFSSISKNTQALSAFVKNVTDLVSKADLDGVDIDWEPPSGGTINIAQMVTELRASLGSQKVISMDVFPNPIKEAGINFPTVAESIDFFNIMGYDYWPDGKLSGPSAPLCSEPEFSNASECQAFNDQKAIAAYLGNVSPGQLNLGVPFYGKEYLSVSELNGICPSGCNPKVPPFSRIEPLVEETNKWNYTFDPAAEEPYLLGINGNVGYITYDDANSMTLKAKYAYGSEHLGGMSMWLVEDDDSSHTLLGALFNVYQQNLTP